MKNIIILWASCLLLTIASVTEVQAQRGKNHDHDHESRKEKIETAKIGLISTNLNLSSEQAQNFWPIYNEYNGKRKENRKAMRQLRTENALLDGTDEELLTDMRKMLVLHRTEVDLEKEYFDKFLKVISPKQLAMLYKTEREFTKILLKRMQED